MQKVFLVCGVPGSGKSWACEQVEDKFTYIRNDDFIAVSKTDRSAYPDAIARMARVSSKPVLADCPFAERDLVEKLGCQGIKVVPIFVVESPEVIRSRYESREGKECPKNNLSRALTIEQRAVEWGSFFGTSAEVLKHLKELKTNA